MQPDIDTASAALKRFQRAGAVAGAVPTPERLLQDRGLARVERSLTFVDVANAAGDVSSVAVRGHRIRITSGPFETMASRKQLDDNPERAGALLSAGRRYQSLWHQAGLSPIQGQDPGKIRSTAGHPGLIGSERQADAFIVYRAASDAMDVRERIAVDAVVLHELALEWVGRRVGRNTEKKIATSLGAHEVRCGLERLAIHFGLLDASAPHPVEVEDDDMPPEMAALLAAMDRREAASA